MHPSSRLRRLRTKPRPTLVDWSPFSKLRPLPLKLSNSRKSYRKKLQGPPERQRFEVGRRKSGA